MDGSNIPKDNGIHIFSLPARGRILQFSRI